MSRAPRKTKLSVVPPPPPIDAYVRLSFVCGADWSSRLIAWWGNGAGGFSHVDALLADGTLLGARDDTIKTKEGVAIPPGVQIRPDNYEKWVRREIVKIPCTSQQAADWDAWLRAQVNSEYDKAAILSFITGTPMHEAGHWICSACQSGGLIQVGLLRPSPIPTSQITPDALYLLATSGIGGQIVPAA